MKWGCSMVVFCVVVSCICMGIIHIRSQAEQSELKRKKFTDIKLQVTNEVLQEYHQEAAKVASQLEWTQAETTRLGEELPQLEKERESQRGPMDICHSDKKQIHDEQGAIESETEIITSDFQEQKTSWEAEKVSLTEKKEEPSHLCDFIHKDKLEARTLCGLGPAPTAPAAPAPPEQDRAEQPEQPGGPRARHASRNDKTKRAAPSQPKAEAPRSEPPEGDAPKTQEEEQEQEEAKAPESPRKADEAHDADGPAPIEQEEAPRKAEAPRNAAPEQAEEEPPKEAPTPPTLRRTPRDGTSKNMNEERAGRERGSPGDGRRNATT